MWRAIWIRLTEQKADYAAPFERSSIARNHRHHLGARGPLPIVNFRYEARGELSEKTLNRLNESLVSEIQGARHRHPVALRIGGKSCVRVCNPKQRS